jgi:hypothetical protein
MRKHARAFSKVIRRIVGPSCLPLSLDLCLPADVATDHGQQRDAEQQRPQAELKPAATAHRRISFGRLGWHARIILGRGQSGQGIQAAHFGAAKSNASLTDRRPLQPGSNRHPCPFRAAPRTESGAVASQLLSVSNTTSRRGRSCREACRLARAEGQFDRASHCLRREEPTGYNRRVSGIANVRLRFR